MIIRGARLADIQAQQVEVGRIRLGTTETKTSRQGRDYQSPVKLDRFRLTSRSEQLIREAAGLYGGEVEPWAPERGAAQWEVIIEKSSIPVIVPPNPCSQFYEMWTGGRCQRRCDGVRELQEDVPCPCGPDPADKKRAGCKPTTRLSLMLAEMNGIGVWRLETHGYYAAAELPAVADLLSQAGGNVPARLELEERQSEVDDPRNPGKTVISRFMVPVLHVEATPSAIVGLFSPRAAIAAPDTPAAIAATAEPAVDPETEQWTLYEYFDNLISLATTREQMTQIRQQIQAHPRLTEEFRANIATAWSVHARRLAGPSHSSPVSAPPVRVPSAPPAVSSTSTAPPAPPASSPAPDRTAEWNRVVELAGGRGLKISDLKRMYVEWSGGTEITTADGSTMGGFRQWLETQ